MSCDFSGYNRAAIVVVTSHRQHYRWFKGYERLTAACDSHDSECQSSSWNETTSWDWDWEYLAAGKCDLHAWSHFMRRRGRSETVQTGKWPPWSFLFSTTRIEGRIQKSHSILEQCHEDMSSVMLSSHRRSLCVFVVFDVLHYVAMVSHFASFNIW